MLPKPRGARRSSSKRSIADPLPALAAFTDERDAALDVAGKAYDRLFGAQQESDLVWLMDSNHATFRLVYRFSLVSEAQTLDETALVEALSHENPYVQEFAAEMLGRNGRQATSALAALAAVETVTDAHQQ